MGYIYIYIIYFPKSCILQLMNSLSLFILNLLKSENKVVKLKIMFTLPSFYEFNL